MQLGEYRDRYRTAKVDRDAQGVLTITLHSRGAPLWWGALPHTELAELFTAVASDGENRVVVLTGTGDRFITMPEGGQAPSPTAASAQPSGIAWPAKGTASSPACWTSTSR